MKFLFTRRCHGMAARIGVALVASQLAISTAWADDAATIADLKNRLDAVQRDVDQLTQNHGRVVGESGIPLHGFADVGYSYASNNQTRLDQAGRGFWGGSLDFYLTPQFSDRTKGLIELIFEFIADGSLATDLERLQLGYTFNDQLTTWMGRFHAPYGYWNTGFHHGAEIQTSISRPRFIDFEDKGGLLPAHVMGAWATGNTHTSGGKVTYDLYVGNGNAIDVDTSGGNTRGSLAINNSRDSNGNKLVGANIGYTAGGLGVGGHAFSERVNINDVVTPADLGEVSAQMTGLYGFYDNDTWEGIAEYYHFNNENLSGGTGSHSSWLAFAQVARAVNDDWTPFIRFERAVLDQNDLYFSAQEYGVSYSRQIVGLRYNLSAKAALKLELSATKEGDGVVTTGVDNGKYSEGRVQYSIRF